VKEGDLDLVRDDLVVF